MRKWWKPSTWKHPVIKVSVIKRGCVSVSQSVPAWACKTLMSFDERKRLELKFIGW